MRKDIYFLIFNDKLSYCINNEIIIEDSSKYISGTIIYNIDLFKQNIEKIIKNKLSIFNFLKPNIYIYLPYNKKLNNYLKYIISPYLYNKLYIKSYKLLLSNYLINSKVIVHNKYTKDTLTKRDLTIEREYNPHNYIEIVNYKGTFYINNINDLIKKKFSI